MFNLKTGFLKIAFLLLVSLILWQAPPVNAEDVTVEPSVGKRGEKLWVTIKGVMFNNVSSSIDMRPLAGAKIEKTEINNRNISLFLNISSNAKPGSRSFDLKDKNKTTVASIDDKFEVRSASPDVKYKTRYFQLNTGALILNPYTIKKNAANKFLLEETGSTDSHFFTEIYFKHRAAWLGRDCSKESFCGDGDFRIGFVSTSQDSSGAVVSGAGDAYVELSVAPANIWPKQDFPDPNKGQSIHDTPVISYHIVLPEFFGGLVTDKGSQAIHYYMGVGPALVFAMPYSDNRKVEALTGIFYGVTQSPQFVDNQTREVESRNDLPIFKSIPSWIWKADVNLPMGDTGFLSFKGRFSYLIDRNDSGHINPWTLSIAYTIPPDVIFDSIAKIVKQ